MKTYNIGTIIDRKIKLYDSNKLYSLAECMRNVKKELHKKDFAKLIDINVKHAIGTAFFSDLVEISCLLEVNKLK